jgi:hypothetical protein
MGDQVPQGDWPPGWAQPRLTCRVEAFESCGEASSGSTSAIGQSSESFPCSTSRSAAAEVIAFVIEAIQNTVSAVIADPSGKARLPNAP